MWHDRLILSSELHTIGWLKLYKRTDIYSEHYLHYSSHVKWKSILTTVRENDQNSKVYNWKRICSDISSPMCTRLRSGRCMTNQIARILDENVSAELKIQPWASKTQNPIMQHVGRRWAFHTDTKPICLYSREMFVPKSMFYLVHWLTMLTCLIIQCTTSD